MMIDPHDRTSFYNSFFIAEPLKPELLTSVPQTVYL